MTRFMLLTGAAALAIGSAAAAAPQQGKGNKSAKSEHSHKQSAQSGKSNGKGSDMRAAKRDDRRSDVGVAQKARGNAKADDRRDERKLARVDRDQRKADRVDDRDDRRDIRRLDRTNRNWADNDNRGGVWADGGCPPGLAKKPVPCVPPGQVKNLVGTSLTSAKQRLAMQGLPTSLKSLYRDDDDHYYQYGNGYVYKVDRDNDLISSLLPLFGLGQTIGQPFPRAYSNSYLPTALQSFYPNAQSNYRYANGYVYKVNPLTGLIEDVDPMLGYGYGYGQMMPATYSAYNVPYQYRSLYQDNNDHYYRYAPGSIYRVDAGSGLIDSIAALLMPGGLSLGQQLPMGYDAYNVPMAYRSQYYDTPQNMYRYANGNIYQVDPTTRLVTAIISALI